MIGHEAIAPDFCTGIESGLVEQVDVKRVVPLLKEDPTSPIPTLLNVVGMTQV